MKAFEIISHCVDARSPVNSQQDGDILGISHQSFPPSHPNPTERTERVESQSTYIIHYFLLQTYLDGYSVQV